MRVPLKFGCFIAPVHALDENPTLQLRRDIELVEHLDRLGFDEAWIGEHHSGGTEIVASAEIDVAAAIELTRRIRIGTGVVTIPYHNPFMVAGRIVQLDHLAMGRMMFGCGAGALAYDAHMIGVDHNAIRDRLDQGLGVILRLFHGETVTESNEWYTLRDARLQILPYSYPHMELAIPAVGTLAGARSAGKYGAGMLSMAATMAKGFDALPLTWDAYAKAAAAAGRTPDRATWRLVGPIHIAETRERARANVRFGLQPWLDYFTKVGTLPLGVSGDGDIDNEIDALIKAGIAVIGTPDDLVAQIERLEKQAGAFGTFLSMSHNWADVAETRKSYELIARFVMPRFGNQIEARLQANRWAKQKHAEFSEYRRLAALREQAKS